MNDFTASNGVRVVDLGGKWDQSLFQFAGEIPGLVDEIRQVREVNFQNPDLIALREFFQAEADERLGRWRWPENPDYVVYSNEDGGVWVHSERDPGAIQYQSPGDVPRAWPSNEKGYVAAARAFFDAHPEKKPWHDAQPGEVWDLDMPSGGVRAVTFYTASTAEPEIVFRDAFKLTVIDLDDPGIREARRVFPEVQS